MGEFKPTAPAKDLVKPNYQLTKLYGEAFPALSSKVLYKVAGASDLAKSKATNLLGGGFKVKQQPQENAKINYTGVQTIELSEGDALSYLGTPIFFQMKLGKGNYNVLDNGKVVQKNFPNDLILPATATAEINRAKVRTSTKINGQAGTVKEFWSFGDWDIMIRGLVLTEGNTHQGQNGKIFPDPELRNIAEWEEIADSIEVTGVLFDIFKIKRLCIDKLQVGQVVGSPNAIPFVMNCVSDEAAEFSIVNNIIQQ